ncbi:alpha/beta hydrolase family protein [Georgenia satyanarayanai]|uniref:alpha/beta hydrolase family protein n=1 Tax=Georgenia satyanarayanai TaxID=860221 RepID=UPI0012655600|nr:alpha/beta family hydrolase [Georgenia satyanarayanai]
MSGETLEIETTHGPARVHLHEGTRGLLVLGHGAGGGVQAPDLRTATAAAGDLGWGVALVEQPYRVAGRRAPAPAKQLDSAWTDVVHHLLAGPGAGLPLVVGGRSSGARVACRTAPVLGAVGVLCLAFPLQPPGRAERPSRLPELDGTGVPTLVVQGERDAFGMPPEGPGRAVVVVAGDHSLKKDQPAIAEAVRTWLERLTPSS